MAYAAKANHWIQNAIKKPGALHKQLGVKQDRPIPAKKLAAAAKKGGKLGARARLAQTLKGLHVVAALFFVVSSTAMATHRYVGNTKCTTDNCQLLNAVAANAAAASRTVTIDTWGWSTVIFHLNYVYNAGTAVTVTCKVSEDGGTTYASVPSTSISAGVGTVTAYSDSLAVSANANMSFPYDVRGVDHLQCVFAVTGGGASDTMTVYASSYKTTAQPLSASFPQ